ncbi:epoxyqueuosine reductase QueH [Lacticaseibacillus mingshuiensis]|uniref:Epoxyqueuosine reductase QueH n=1 Tax=Lacticaseibacillus mingshuiensis TaxID=2799574 RepID=A0ABW4CKK3_9LACO|nr:epoxyqueuosine reductase QueH [Lacticaseibacillus mingshuiensis]
MLEYDQIAAEFEQGQKINFDRILQEVIAGWQRDGARPRLMMHSCCAPCSTYTLEYLTQFADVTIYYYNPNIHPRMEYERRKLVQEQFILDFNQKTGNDVHFISAEYRPSDWLAQTKALKDEPEGGARCKVCYDFRLDAVAAKAQELGFDYFGSTLTISPSKNAQWINEGGLEIQHLYNVAYLPSDFKKRGGYKRSVEMCAEYNVYRQCYCGCLFAAKKQGIDLAAVNREATQYVAQHENDDFAAIQFNIAAKAESI